MSQWDDASLVSSFPDAAGVPARWRIDPAKHPPRWLVDGELRGFAGPTRTVTSRVALRAGSTLAATPLGQEAMLTEAEAREAVARRTRRFARKQRTFFDSFDAVRIVDVAADEPADAVAARVLGILPPQRGGRSA